MKHYTHWELANLVTNKLATVMLVLIKAAENCYTDFSGKERLEGQISVINRSLILRCMVPRIYSLYTVYCCMWLSLFNNAYRSAV